MLIGKCRVLIAVAGAATLVVATSPASEGLQAVSAGPAVAAASGPAPDFPAARGITLRSAGGTQSAVSGNGRWQVYTDGYTVYARDLQDPSAPPQPISIGNSGIGNGSTAQLGQQTTPDGALPDGPSSQPSISADGRYVSFLTFAMNITPVPPAMEGVDFSLIVCDRDPSGARDANGNPVLDQRVNGHSYPDYRCEYVYASYHNAGSDVVAAQRPHLSADGTHIVYVRHMPPPPPDGSGFTPPHPDQAFVSVVSNGNGLATPNPVEVGVRLPGDTATSYPGAFDAWLDADASNAYFVADVGSSGDPALIRSSLSAALVTTGSLRLDVNPSEFGAGYLGDHHGNEYSEISGLSVAQNGSEVAFVVRRVLVILTFGPHSAAAAAVSQPEGYHAYGVHVSGSTATSQLVSRNTAGDPVPSTAVGVSGDGRYVAFTTSAADTHDGTDETGVQIVARDLTLDADRAANGSTRLPGALVTAATDCTPTSPAVTCGSSNAFDVGNPANAFTPEIAMDFRGFRVGFDTAAGDLVAGDSGTGADAFVHTWTPELTSQPLDFGDVQVGTQSIANVPVAVTGFGPALLGDATLDPATTTDFALDGSTCTGRTVHVGSECTVSLRATPRSPTPQVKTASVRLPLVDAGVAPTVATLTATATTTGPLASPADTVRTSLDADGAQVPEGGTQAQISGNGRWQVFASEGDLTDRTDTAPGEYNVFVRDLADPPHTLQLSLHSRLGDGPLLPSRPVATPAHPTGSMPNGNSTHPSISADGRFVSFLTDATDIVPGRDLATHTRSATQYQTVVVCDRDPSGAVDAAGNPVLDQLQPGSQVPDYVCFPIETAWSGRSGPNPTYTPPRLSADGTKVAWVEDGPGTTNAGRRVRIATLRTSTGPLRAPSADDYVYAPSDVAGLRSGLDRDTETVQDDPALTADGTAVVFTATQCCSADVPQVAVVETTLPPGMDGWHSTRFDVIPGVDGFLGGDGGDFGAPAVSGDGNRVAFAFSPQSGSSHEVYVATRSAGGAVGSVVASLDNHGQETGGIQPALSGDGRYLAFVATQPNSHNGVDAPGVCSDGRKFGQVSCQIVARDLVADAQRAAAGLPAVPSQLVSRSLTADCIPTLPAGRVCAGDDRSSGPSVDETGSEIAFASTADDLVPDDTNVAQQTPGFAAPRARLDATAQPSQVDTFVSTWRPTVTMPATDFGSVLLGTSSTRTFPVTLVGFGPLSLGRASIVGPNAADFGVVATSCAGTTLHEAPPAEQCSYRLRFTPSAQGSRAATLTTAIEKNSYPRTSPDGSRTYDPALVQDVAGFGATPLAAVSPNALDFGAPLPTVRVTRLVKIANTGTAPLRVITVVVHDTAHPGAHTQYGIDVSGCVGGVPIGGSCLVRVTYRAAKVGIQDAVLVVTTNSLAGPASIPMRARVNKPTVQSNPAVTPVRRVITVTGTGYAPNHPVDIGFDGQRQLTVSTRPDGTFRAQLVVLPNGPQGPRSLTASSAGLDASIADDYPILVVLGSTDPGVVVKRD